MHLYVISTWLSQSHIHCVRNTRTAKRFMNLTKFYSGNNTHSLNHGPSSYGLFPHFLSISMNIISKIIYIWKTKKVLWWITVIASAFRKMVNFRMPNTIWQYSICGFFEHCVCDSRGIDVHAYAITNIHMSIYHFLSVRQCELCTHLIIALG